jgi:hypothetical protein
VLRVVLDNDALFLLAHRNREPDEQAIAVLRSAVLDGRVQLLATHILRAEANGGGDHRRKQQVARVLDLAIDVPTGSFMVGVSAVGEAAIGLDGPAMKRLREGITTANLVHAHDALQVATAVAEAAAFLSADNRAVRRARELGVEVITPLELLLRLGYEL